MSYSANIRVRGVDATIRDLIKYNEAFYKKALMIGENAAKIVENVAKQNAPMGKTGNLRRSIKRKKVDVDRAAFTVMPRAGRGGNHRHFVAYGTAPRTRKNGGSTGVMPANGSDYMMEAEKAAKPYFESSLKAEAKRSVYI